MIGLLVAAYMYLWKPGTGKRLADNQGPLYLFFYNELYAVQPWVRGFQVPTRPGVRLHHLLTVNLGAGTTRHVVKDVGSQVDNSNTGTPSYVSEYP